MNNYRNVREIKNSEFEELIEFVDLCYPGDKEKGGLLAGWPHCYLRDGGKFREHIIIKEDNKIVSHVGCINQILSVNNEEFRIIGISGVATHPEFRNQGLMSKLFNYCIKRMEEEKIPISVLGGDRQRYNNFGFENGVRQLVFTVTPRSINSLELKENKFKIFKYHGEFELLQSIIKIHEKEKLMVKRTKEMYQLLMNRNGINVFLSTNKRNWSYVVTDINDNEKICSITEFGGDNECMKNIISYLFKGNKFENIIICSPVQHYLNQLFFKISSGFEIKPLCMIKIVNLKETLEGFLEKIKEKINYNNIKAEGEITLEIKNTSERISLLFSQDNIELSDKKTKNKISLSEIDMVKFIFGITEPHNQFKLKPSIRFLDFIFPLDFYIWRNERV